MVRLWVVSFLLSALVVGCAGSGSTSSPNNAGAVSSPAAQTASPPQPAVKVPFAIITQTITGTRLGGAWYTATAKDQYRFVTVAVRAVRNGEQVSPSILKCTLVDKSGTEYQPYAFAVPAQGYQDPFFILAESFTEPIEFDGTELTYFALVFVVPSTANEFTMRDNASESIPLTVLNAYNPPDSARIKGFKGGGSLDIAVPTAINPPWLEKGELKP
jgi:hypothetical protein